MNLVNEKNIEKYNEFMDSFDFLCENEMEDDE